MNCQEEALQILELAPSMTGSKNGKAECFWLWVLFWLGSSQHETSAVAQTAHTIHSVFVLTYVSISKHMLYIYHTFYTHSIYYTIHWRCLLAEGRCLPIFMGFSYFDCKVGVDVHVGVDVRGW